MTCFRRKGNRSVHTAPRIKSAVFRIHTGFPCSAEQKCVSHVANRSRICHKISRYLWMPPVGWLSLFFLNATGRGIDGIEVGRSPPKAQSGGLPLHGLRKGELHRPVIIYSDCFFLAVCCARRCSASAFFSALRCL